MNGANNSNEWKPLTRIEKRDRAEMIATNRDKIKCFLRTEGSASDLRQTSSFRERSTDMRGTLTRFNPHDGIGAITSEEGIELLVHKNSMEPNPSPLKQGQTVEFRIYYGPYGPIAENVQRFVP